MTPWALVRIGSISKVVTSVAIMKLVEEGRVNLQTRVFGATGEIYIYIYIYVCVCVCVCGKERETLINVN